MVSGLIFLTLAYWSNHESGSFSIVVILGVFIYPPFYLMFSPSPWLLYMLVASDTD